MTDVPEALHPPHRCSASLLRVCTSPSARACTEGLGHRGLRGPPEQGCQQQSCRDLVIVLGLGGSSASVHVGLMLLALPAAVPASRSLACLGPFQRERATSCSLGSTCSFKDMLWCSG